MRDVVSALELAAVVVYVGLALVTAGQWLRHRSRPAAWAAATFTALGSVLGLAQLVPEQPEGVGLLAIKSLVVVLVLFPYCLFRFVDALEPVREGVRRLALGLTAVVAAGVLAFQDAPGVGDPRPRSVVLYSLLVLLQWGVLSMVVARRLWRAGIGRPTVVRRRMWTLAAGAVGLVLVLAIRVVSPGEDRQATATTSDLVVAVLTLAAGPLFLVGLAPPRTLVARWRRPEEEALHEAEVALMAATSRAEVADGLLPHIAATLGSRRVRLVDGDGRESASHAERAPLELSPMVLAGEAHSAPMHSGSLTVEADPYAPFFGREGLDLLRRLAGLTDVALRRAEVTERERATAAELAASNRAMREFVAVASHDLRTPLTVVKGYAELLVTVGGAMSEADRERHLRTIVRQADHLSTIVEDLLTVSRLDAGRLDPEPVAVDLAQLVPVVVDELGACGGVAVDVAEGVVAHADVDHVIRIVRNLVENACRYGDGPVLVTGRDDGDDVVLRVRDHGAGVPDAFVPRLFDRFARADVAEQRAKDGTGLGLSIVRGLAQTAGGDAWYEPTEAGACFAVRLPRSTRAPL